jgi:prophage integrase
MKMVKPLTETTLRSLKPKSKEYIKSDGNDLYIRIKPNKTKCWYFSYKFAGKEKKMSLGAYPDLSLNFAREIAQEYRGLILRNIDPAAYRQSLNNPVEEKKVTFSEMAMMWRDKRLKLGKLKAQTVNEAFRRVELHLFPKIADLPIE